MPTITVRDMPPGLYEKLKLSAELSHRSLNSEIIECLERGVCSRPVDPDRVLANARRLRRRTASHPITDEEFSQAKHASRR